ncbi:sensor histidine kinase [uncultured Sphaerochaeta sp.]|uniref:ATP-binding protein n=1 Tax=uncultured Sphaerochaeta sp. TaxID=886478 RepID=UPI002A0A7461|nr:sensor histidine kinase [uncultured Sphaerochaeta sp.]
MHIFICDFLLDIVQNSFEAESTYVSLILEETEDRLRCLVQDNGKGMDEQLQKRVLDPFYTDGVKHQKRKVGLGLPFLIQAVEAAGGTFSLNSEVGKGTQVDFSFDLYNIDTPPLGDLPSTLRLLFSHPLAFGFCVKRSLTTRKGQGEYEISKSELVDVLGTLTQCGTMTLLLEFLTSQEDDLKRFYVEHAPSVV